jgi:hypothetical protein
MIFSFHAHDAYSFGIPAFGARSNDMGCGEGDECETEEEEADDEEDEESGPEEKEESSTSKETIIPGGPLMREQKATPSTKSTVARFSRSLACATGRRSRAGTLTLLMPFRQPKAAAWAVRRKAE